MLQFFGSRSSLKAMTAIVSVLLICPDVAITAPREAKFKDQNLDAKPGDKVALSCPRAVVRLSGTTNPATVLRARKSLADKASADVASRFEGLSFNVHREGSVIFVECSPSESKAGGPDMYFEFEGAGLPIEMAVREGNLSLQNWKQPVAAMIVEGNVRAQTTQGPLRLHLQRGDVKVEGHKGRLDIESRSAKIAVTNVEGDVNVVNFAGDTQLSAVRGNIDTKLDSGAFTVAKSSGSLDFVLGRGALNAAGFEGSLKGESQSGSVQAELIGEADVNIETERGSVTLKPPARSGAQLRLQTVDGSLALPGGVSASPSNPKAANGALPGGGPKGKIVVHSKSGAIRLRD